MNNKVIGTIKKYNMLSYGERVLIAVSGGADSMALLNILLEVRDEYNLDIEVAHIEHGIRGEESESDALFVSDFCKRNKIVFHIKSINAVEEAKEAKMGVEEYSRQVRYDFFNSLECDKIATAHSLSDSIETTVFRLIRGSGLKGVCGISPVRGKIIRPLIECTSSEIREFCKEKNIDYCIDSTNNDNSYSRNYIRNVLLPQFCEINSDYEKAIGVFVADSAEDYSFIEKTAQIEYKNCLCKKGLLIEKLKNLDNAIVKRVIFLYFGSYGITLDRLHLTEILGLLNKTGKIQISNNIFAVADSKILRYADFSNININKIDNFVSKILNVFEFQANTVDFYCDYDKIIDNVLIRSRQTGDEISPVGRHCTKSLKKLFNEYKIPQETRNSIGIVADDEGVIGVVGYCVDERVKVDSSTKRIFTIRIPSED